MRFLLLCSIRLYQFLVSPLMGTACRFTPTCSHYAAEAVRVHGTGRGMWLAVRRLARCHPFGAHGHDPVPCSLHSKTQS